MIRIEDKRELFTFIKQKMILKTFFNNKKLILVNCLDLKSLHPNMYKDTY